MLLLLRQSNIKQLQRRDMERQVLIMDYTKIGKFIAEKRKERGLTQKELARQLGIGDKAVSKWECGRGMPDNSIMLPLCSLLEISVNELLMGESLSKKDYDESTEGIILTLMEEKETLKKKSKKNMLSGILLVLFVAILLLLTSIPFQSWYGWLYFYDPAALVTDIIFVLVMLLATGSVKAFFRSFLLMRKKDVDRHGIFSSLQSVKLAIASFLLGGGLLSLIDTIFVLRTMKEAPRIGVSVSLLAMFYGTLLAFLLLPVKYALELKMEELDEKSDKSGIL